MSRSAMFERFAEASPVTVLVRILLERVLAPRVLDELFARHAVRQRCGETLFSTLVDLMGLVVLREKPYLHAAYQARLDDVTVSIQAVYAKLNGLEPQVSAALVRETGRQFKDILDGLNSRRESPLPGYRVRVLDGNRLGGTDHRLKVLRQSGAAALPGEVLALFDPTTRLLADVVCCEDGHAQERSLLPQLYDLLRAGEVLIADRGFCTTAFVHELGRRRVHFLIRQHSTNLPVEELDKPRSRGRLADGCLFEQRVRARDCDGQECILRRITIRLDRPTRFGESEVHLITDLPAEVSARTLAQAYRSRWTIETCFGHLAKTVHGELNTLGYPKAALFGFCLAVVMYNVLATVLGVLGAQFGMAKIDERVSLYYLAEETSSVYAGMLIAVPARVWRRLYSEMPLSQLTAEMLSIARGVKLQRFQKHPRGPKKPPPRRTKAQRGQHVATARLLATRNPKR